MTVADGIQRWDVRFMPPSGKPMLRADSGGWVRFSDVQARLAAADRLAEAVEASGATNPRIDAALDAYRDATS